MKTKKVIVGALAASMLSLSVCSIAPVSFAAGETVQISVSKENAKAGESFTVEVSLADIPSSGLQAVEFAIEYDNSLISIDPVTAGSITATGAADADPTSAVVPTFDSYKNGKTIGITWSTQLSDKSYWLKKDGVFCTLSGKVSSSAKDGDVANIKVIPLDRSVTVGSTTKNDKVLCGYTDDNDNAVACEVKITNGSVTVGSGVAQATLRGDSNCDGKVTIADAVFIMQSLALPGKYQLSKQGEANGDVEGDNDGITNKDALKIQQYMLGIIKQL